MSATATSANASSAEAAAAAILATMLSLPPPPGQSVNTVNPPSRQTAIIAVCTVFLFLTLFFVLSRLYANFFVNRSQGLEDYICIIATGLSIAYIGFILDLSWVSRHMWDVPVIWFSGHYWKLRYAQNNIVALAFFTSRIPILVLYLRVFGTAKRLRYAVYFGLFADALVYLCNIPILAIFCAPPPGGLWANTFEKCQRIRPLAVAQGSCNIALDIYILVLPLRPIWNLNMPYRRKLGIMVIFTTGLFALIASCISLYYRFKLTYTSDVNWNEGAFVASAVVEINVAIICSSMPACSSLFKHFVDNGSFTSFASLFSRKASTFSLTGPSTSKKSAMRDDSGKVYDSSSTRIHDGNYNELKNSIAANIDHIHGAEENGVLKTVDVDIV